MKISELKARKIDNTEYGDNLNTITATVKSAEPHATKSGKKGPYTQQKCRLADDSGEINCTFWNHKDMSAYVGQTITITAKPWRGYTKGLSVNTYEGHNYIRADENATISLGTGVMEPDDSDFPPIEEYTKEQPPTPAPVKLPEIDKKPEPKPAPYANGNGKDRDVMMMTSYVKDLVIAYVSSGMEPSESLAKALAQIEFIYENTAKIINKVA